MLSATQLLWIGRIHSFIIAGLLVSVGGLGDRIGRNASIDGWVESRVLAHHATLWAENITRITGDAVGALDLAEYQPVPEVPGITDNWWRGTPSLLSIEAKPNASQRPQCRAAHIYGGPDDWGLHGG
ncbi:hypothetical protein ACFXOD_27615 [Streptomyces sp. NPDC059161]|uniref:hypothetical protein n=1 Tax=Streptomyces sp. NPDC059161 TaxID=3346749 RepID=UPI003678044B